MQKKKKEKPHDNFMPQELQKAHNANNRAVMQAYGFSAKNMSEEDCVAELMKLYNYQIDKSR